MMGFEDVYRLFFNDGDVVEIRSFGLNGKGPWDGYARGAGVVFGYFDNPIAFGHAASLLDKHGQASGIYFSLNPVYPELIGRAANRLKAADNKSKTTGDAHIKCIRWLPIDLDPLRAGGLQDLNSSDAELTAAMDLRAKILSDCREGFGAVGGVSAISGNGAHLLFRLPDLAVDDLTRNQVKKCLAGIKHRWGIDSVDVDQKVFNPARIWKIYGTTARKSDHTADRPQRQARIIYEGERAPALADIPHDFGLIARLGSLAPADEPAPPKPQPAPADHRTQHTGSGSLGKMDVGRYLAHYAVGVTKTKPCRGGTQHILGRCLFNSDHGPGEASIVQASGGLITYQCFHNSCAGHTWMNARQLISGQDSLAHFCDGYDPNYGQRQQPPPLGLPYNPVEAQPLPFMGTNKTGRPAMNPAIAANFFEDRLSPIFCEGGNANFWQYKPSGVWKKLETGFINRLIRREMGDIYKPNWGKQIVDTLIAQCFVREEELDAPGLMINIKNGMFDIAKNKLCPHDSKYYSRIQMPVSLNEEANCDSWLTFLGQIFSDDLQKIQLLREFFAYCLYPRILFPGVIFAIGGGGNGKGVVEHILTKMLGDQNVCNIGLARLEQRFGANELDGKLLNSCGETVSKRIDLAVFKQASSGDRLQAETKGGKDVSFWPVAKHWFSMNRWPSVDEKTNALYRRVSPIEFKQSFEGKADDPFLKEKLEAEIDGIFLWAVSELPLLIAQKRFTNISATSEAIAKLQENIDNIVVFIRHGCETGPDTKVLKKEFYIAYERFCFESGLKPKGKIKFFDHVEALGYVTKKIEGYYYFKGVAPSPPE